MIKQIYIFIIIIYYDDLETRQSNKHSSFQIFFQKKMVHQPSFHLLFTRTFSLITYSDFLSQCKYFDTAMQFKKCLHKQEVHSRLYQSKKNLELLFGRGVE